MYKQLFKKITVLVLFLAGTGNLFSQINIKFEIKADTVVTNLYEFTDLGKSQAFVKMAFGSYKITNSQVVKDFEDKEIKQVDLIYSDCPAGRDFTALNKKRLIALYSIEPQLFNDSNIRWKIIKQTGVNKKNKFEAYHGFAVYYKNRGNFVKITEEMKYISDVVDGKIPLKDSTVLKVFERNKEWKNMLIVSDLTASMSPFIGELLLWFKLSLKDSKVKSFVFFNDGDEKLTSQKIIGETGGIYVGEADNLDKILDLAFKTMGKGYGGDLPENDAEAILKGIAAVEKFDELVLIADNSSSVRDLELISKINVPVKVILCGTDRGIHIDYLELAYKTKGSVHTIEEDITKLMDLNEGEIIEISGIEYQIKQGKFMRLYRN